MHNISLDSITEHDLAGYWNVLERYVNKKSEGAVFANQNFLELSITGNFKTTNGKTFSGIWTILQEKEIIYNPQIKFHLSEVHIEQAIITRMISLVEEDKMIYKLTLYFNTGLELTLQKTNPVLPA